MNNLEKRAIVDVGSCKKFISIQILIAGFLSYLRKFGNKSISEYLVATL